MAILIGIGIHLSTPGHHATSILAEYLDSALADMPFLKNILPDWATQTGNLKALALVVLTWFAFIHLSSIDPLSNTPLLRAIATKELGLKSKPWLYRGMPELAYYASHTPSARIVRWCKACAKELGCINRLESEAEAGALAPWLTIAKGLPAHNLHEHLFLTNQCRTLALLRIGTLSAAIALIPVCLAARGLEVLRNVPVNPNPQLLIYILSLGLLGGLVNRILFGGEHRPGFWGHLKDNVDRIFQYQVIGTLLEKHVCARADKEVVFPSPDSRPAPERSLQSALTLVNTLDVLVERKAVAILRSARAPQRNTT